jgi:hypothetical protein
MNDFLKQDIFFFVTTVAVVLFIIFGIVVGLYTVRIIKNIDYISKRARQQTDLISEDLDSLRDKMKEGFRIRHLWDFFKNINKKGKK